MIVMMSDCALSYGKGPRAAFRERGLWMCIWIPFYEDVQIFLSTPFETLPDQKFPEQPTNKSENFPLGGVHTCKSRILALESI